MVDFGPASRCTRISTGIATADVVQVLNDAYAAEPFVTVLAPDVWPGTDMVQGSNSAVLQAVVDQHSGRVQVVCAIDNLGKGAAGQAIQNANLMLGFDESLGLSTIGIAP